MVTTVLFPPQFIYACHSFMFRPTFPFDKGQLKTFVLENREPEQKYSKKKTPFWGVLYLFWA